MVVDEFWPVEQISQSVEGSQLATKCFLPFVIRSRVRATEIIYWSHHTQTWHKEVANSQSVVNIAIEIGQQGKERRKQLKNPNWKIVSVQYITHCDCRQSWGQTFAHYHSVYLLTHVECCHSSLWGSRIHGGHTRGHKVSDLLQSQQASGSLPFL